MNNKELANATNRKELANGTNRKELASYYLTGEEVADYWRICISSVYVLIRTGRLRACKICGQWLISPEAIIEFA